MAAPIMSEGYAIGVIRLPANRKKRKEYTEDERNLFQIFANRISVSIENSRTIEKLDNLIRVYSDIGMSKDDLDGLLKIVVDGVPAIVGGGGCSVFLLENLENANNTKFVLKKTNSVSDRFNKSIDKLSYEENGKGLTAFAATTRTIVQIKDVSDKKEVEGLKINNYLDPIHIKGPCEIDKIGPFLAAPINYEGKTIGVIRIPRYKDAKPFDEIDAKVTKSFCRPIIIENH